MQSIYDSADRTLKCLICIGSGRMMGGGMIYKDCTSCNGSGIRRVNSFPEKPKIVVDRRSKSYKEAIAKLMEGGLDKDEAARVFDEEFEKL